MATTDDRIDDLKTVVSEINNRLTEVEKTVSKTREEKLCSDLEFYKTLTETVSKATTEAINPLIEKLEEQNKRITTLEQSEANKALEEKKDKRKFTRDVVVAGIVSTVLGWIVLSFLNNYASITSDKIRSNVENEVSINEKTNQNII